MSDPQSLTPESSDPERVFPSPRQTSSAQGHHHPESHRSSPESSGVALQQLNAVYDRIAPHQNESSADEDLSFTLRDPRSTSADQDVHPVHRSSVCDVCLAANKSGSLVRPLIEGCDKYLDICIQVNEEHRTPFRGALQRAQTVFSDDVVNACRACRREFNRILNTSKRNQKEVATLRRAIGRRFARNELADSTFSDGAALETIESQHCFLSHYTRRESCSTSCSPAGSTLARPLRLFAAEDWKKEEWITAFAKKQFVSTNVAQQLAESSQPRNVKLCPRHYAAMRHVLDNIEAMQKACSVCKGASLRKSIGKMTRFRYDEIREKPDTMIIIEDALISYVGRAFRLKDIEYLCASCRNILCHRISLSDLSVRCDERTKLRKGDFVYGPTPRAIRHFISFVESELNKDNKLMVRLVDLQRKYIQFIHSDNDMVEKQLVVKDIRTLKKYLLPSLAARGIHLEIGARKMGNYFCTLDTIRRLVAESSLTRRRENAEAKSVELTLKQRNESLLELGKVFTEKKDDIESGNWDIAEYIRATPRRLWKYEIYPYISQVEALKSAVAQTQS